MTATPPFELARLGLDRDRFQKAGAKGWRGPCPRCGGNRHLLIFTDHPFPKWHCECQSCGLKAWADQLEPAVKVELTPEEKRRFAEQRAAQQAAAEKERLALLNEYTAAELWEACARKLADDHRAWWEQQGIPAAWQDYLRIGFQPSKVYRGANGELHTSAAYTIPYFHTGWEFVTLQYRLFDPPTVTDRYRWEKGLGTAYYDTQPEHPIGERVIICEGAKKAIVTAVYTPEAYSVLAVPSKADFGGVAAAVQDASAVYVLLDPDAGQRARKLAGEIGPAARVVSMPVKVDDALVRYGATTADLLAYLRTAV
jgi:hypothetical protein